MRQIGVVAVVIASLTDLVAVSFAAQAARAASVSMSGPNALPSLERQVLPAYPKDLSFAGVVDVETAVNTAGTTVHARVVPLTGSTWTPVERAAHQALGQACVGVIMKWRFKPPTDTMGRSQATFFVSRFEVAPPLSTDRAGVVSVRLVPLTHDPPPTREALGDLVVHSVREPGMVFPKAVREVKPQYTPDGMRAKAQGDVEMELVVLADGTVGAARVTKSLEASLDRAALIAARHWIFEPARLKDQPVAVAVMLSLGFRLH